MFNVSSIRHLSPFFSGFYNVVICIILIICPITRLFSAKIDTTKFIISLGISKRSENIDFSSINDLIKRFHPTDGFKNYFPMGIDESFIYIKNKLVLSQNLSFYYDKMRWKDHVGYNESIALFRLSNVAKLGFLPYPESRKFIFPYICFDLESLFLSVDLNLGTYHNFFFRQ